MKQIARLLMLALALVSSKPAFAGAPAPNVTPEAYEQELRDLRTRVNHAVTSGLSEAEREALLTGVQNSMREMTPVQKLKLVEGLLETLKMAAENSNEGEIRIFSGALAVTIVTAMVLVTPSNKIRRVAAGLFLAASVFGAYKMVTHIQINSDQLTSLSVEMKNLKEAILNEIEINALDAK